MFKVVLMATLATFASPVGSVWAQTDTAPPTATEMPAETADEEATDSDDDDFDMGWIGLLGLIGLAGLAGRNRRPVTGNTTTRRM
jgi:MYXO-CTERM domain-containing protein